MTWNANIGRIKGIIPQRRKKMFRRLMLESFGFALIELLSIAYLVPVLMLLLDREKLGDMLSRMNLQVELNSNTIIVGITMLVAFYVTKNLIQVRFNKRLQQFLYGMAHDLSMETLSEFVHADYRAFQGQDKGTLIRNTARVARDFSVSVVGSLFVLVSESLTFAIILITLLFFYFKLTLVAFFVVGLFALIIYNLKRSEARLISETYKTVSTDANAEMLNIIDGYIEIKSTGTGSAFLNRFARHNQKLNRVTAMLNASSGNYQKYMEIFLVTGIGGLVLYSMQSNTNNTMLIAVLAAISVRMVPSLGRIMTSATLFNSHLYSVAVLNHRRGKDNEKTFSTFENSIELKNIGFEYISGKPIFENLNLTLKPGKIVGIKGVTGAGKTTFLHIVAGLIAPNTGEIKIDGISVEQNHFFPFIGYVPQQPFLFNGTIYENITMLNPMGNDASYIDYLAENLQLTEIFDNQPQRLDTIISHNTSKLSGGQKQRIALLRALYHKPKLLILDEATNQQNEEMEALIFKFLRRIASEKKMAILTVSHDRSLEQFCDEMHELKNQRLQ